MISAHPKSFLKNLCTLTTLASCSYSPVKYSLSLTVWFSQAQERLPLSFYDRSAVLVLPVSDLKVPSKSEMTIFNCLCARSWRKKRQPNNLNTLPSGKGRNGLNTLQVKLEKPAVESSDQENPLNSTSFSVSLPFSIPKTSRCNVKVVNHDSPVNREELEVDYKGEDESDDKSPTKRDMPDIDAQEFQIQRENENPPDSFAAELGSCSKGKMIKDDANEDLDMINSGNLSDPGTKGEHWTSPKLKRSCSSLDTREVLKKIVGQLPSKSQSYEQLQELAAIAKEDVLPGTPMSQTSAMSHFSADKVMLKKCSSSQILPSRSRRLWWKLFLWSHRNLQKPLGVKTRPAHGEAFNQLGGYSSDTLEPSRAKELKRPETPDSFSGEQTEETAHAYKNDDDDIWAYDRFEKGGVGLWPQNQWVAFSMQSSPLQRVDEWMKDLDIDPVDEGEEDTMGTEFPPETSMSVPKSKSFPTTHHSMSLSADVLHANSVIQSLNSSSTVAHISGMGLKVIPTISHFFRLRSVNLSNNSIAHIPNGHLPKGLHVLDLSRNKISNIEGLRELPRLRVLNLRLSKCALLKELYIAGNKINDVEGLHRLLKLTVLDLSFNKITTAKALGQLVANYSSLLALNLLGNPIQSNLGDDQLKKAVCGLLPKLAFLNKQPINLQKARQVATDIVVKASSGSGGSRSGHRKVVKKVGHGGSARSNASVGGQRSKSRLNGKSQQLSNLRIRSPA
ncbi:hypothetical protein V2J09_008563 [Rumex salicifolius]